MHKTTPHSRLLTLLLVAALVLTLLPASVLAVEGEGNATFDATTTSILTSSYMNNQILRIESYLTNRDTTEVTIDPCDIIFVVDQSRWMNTATDAGAQREVIINAMKDLLGSLAEPTTGGEHRVAIAGYGRVNVGAVDNYDASIYPGVQSASGGISFNTGYYTANGFISQNGWTDVSAANMAGSDLPQMPQSYADGMTYDSAFLTLDEAETVLNPSTMQAWYAGASRLDAGLSIAEQLAAIAAEHDVNSDRNLIVCIMSSSLPIQNTFSTDTSVIRTDAVLTAAAQLKAMGATIFGFGDYHASDKVISGDVADTEANYIATMQQVCTNASDFYALSGYSSVTDAMNGLVTNITITSAGSANREYTIEANEFTVLETTYAADMETAEHTITVSWADLCAYYGDALGNIVDNTMTYVEFFNFTGYDANGEPTFADTANVSFDVPLSEMATDDGIAYATTMIPIPSLTTATTNYGYKVVITIAAPIVIDYEWASSEAGYAPANAVLPGTETIVLGTTHAAQSVKSSDGRTDEHYVFNGWYTDTACTSAYTDETTPLTSFTLYGKWTKYTLLEYYWDIWSNVSVDHNGATQYDYNDNPDDYAHLNYGETPTTYTPEGVTGYTFGGWYLDKGCTQPYEAKPLTEDTKIYAKWVSTETSEDDTEDNTEDNGGNGTDPSNPGHVGTMEEEIETPDDSQTATENPDDVQLEETDNLDEDVTTPEDTEEIDHAAASDMELESGEESNESADAAQPSTASNVPYTGDSTNLLFWLVLLLASGLCIACIMVDLKRKKAHK
jgi:uncharacterized repeat protein (TIGR02543 family)